MRIFLLVILIFVVQLLPAQSLDEAVSLFQKRKFEEAKPIFEQVIRKDKKNAQAQYYLATIHLIPAYRDNDKATDLAEAAIKLDGNNADYHYIHGAALGSKMREAGAIKQALLAPKVRNAFAKAVELNPGHVQARVGLIQYLLNAPSILGGDKEKAAEHIETVIKLDEVAGRSFKSRLLEAEKKQSEAEQELKIVVQNHSSDWRGWKNLGYYYLRTGVHEKSIEAFKKYVSVKPDTADSHDSLGEAYVLKGDADQALIHLNKSLQLDPGFGSSLLMIGRAYELKKQTKEAREAYQKLLAVDSDPNRRKEAEKKLKELK